MNASMADLARAEKLAAAKRRLKQFQQKQRDCQSESGRSTPVKTKLEEDVGSKQLHTGSENGGSTYSFFPSENQNCNISGSSSPVQHMNNSLDNLCQMMNGNSQPDIVSISNALNNLPRVSESFFQSPSSLSFSNESPVPAKSQSGSDFFDNLSLSKDLPEKSSLELTSAQNSGQVLNHLRNFSIHEKPLINASTPDGPLCDNTPNYSFPETSVSPITEVNHNIAQYISRVTNGDLVESELELKLKNTYATNDQLEQEIATQKTQILQLQSHVEELQKKADEGASTLKHHVQAIEILVSEKTELQSALDKRQEDLDKRSGEVEELRARLQASRHRVADLERDLASARAQIQALHSSVTDITAQQSTLLEYSDKQGKHIGDLELEVSDLSSKLDSRDQLLSALRAELEERTSQLSLVEVRIQQLSGGSEISHHVENDLRQKNEELLNKVQNLEDELSSSKAANEESVREYQKYMNRLHMELQEIKTENEEIIERCNQLSLREQQLIQQVSELERLLNRTVAPTVEDETLGSLKQQLELSQQSGNELQSQLVQKEQEMLCLLEGLEERALRIQELELTVTRLEAERPDAVSLQAAIESDKVAASRAVSQNNSLKKQLEELQDSMIKLNQSKTELTQLLHEEQQRNRELIEKLAKLQESKTEDVEKYQQTENPVLEESECQTSHSHSIVSPEVMVRLEEKFRKTMGELADLSDEKQRLEHLVTQLQSETETIGEYIALYQLQRGMLRQRAQEKEEQVARLARDKEALRAQLTRLNCLVQRLVGQGHDLDVAAEVKELNDPAVLPSTEDKNIQTADQIRSLLSEIGSNNLVITSLGNNNISFHPCPHCSGKLTTV